MPIYKWKRSQSEWTSYRAISVINIPEKKSRVGTWIDKVVACSESQLGDRRCGYEKVGAVRCGPDFYIKNYLRKIPGEDKGTDYYFYEPGEGLR